MSKAILVMDMPNKCGECPLYKVAAGNELCRAKIRATSVEGTLTAAYAKPSWCPLKPLPEKDNDSYYPDEYADGYAGGWNACIDAIGGGEHGGQ